MATKKRVPPPIEEEEIELEQPGEYQPLELYRVTPESPRIRALIYSEPGGGKTTLASTAQDHAAMAPVVFASIEGGLISVAHRQDLHAVDIHSTAELYSLYRHIADKIEPFDEVGTLVIDNITELQNLNLDEIVEQEIAHGKSGRDDPDFIDQGDYGKSTLQLARIVRWFKNLDINIIITAHAKFVYPASRNGRQGTNMDVEPVAVMPMLTQKLAKTIMGMVDYVWFLQYVPEEDKRYMLTRPDGIYQAKTRGPHFAQALGPTVKEPTMPRLYDLLVKSESQAKRKK